MNVQTKENHETIFYMIYLQMFFFIYIYIYISNPGHELRHQWHAHTHIVPYIDKNSFATREGPKIGVKFSRQSPTSSPQQRYDYIAICRHEKTHPTFVRFADPWVSCGFVEEDRFSNHKSTYTRGLKKWNTTLTQLHVWVPRAHSTCPICNLYQTLTFVPQVLPKGITWKTTNTKASRFTI